MKPKSYYPLALDLDGKRCLVVGGGRVAERKVKRLLEYGAKVELVSPSLTPALEQWAREGRFQCRRGRFSGRYLKKQTLLFAVTDDVSLNQRIVKTAGKKGILVNCAKPGNASGFIVPAVVKRGSFTVAISTDGRSPKKARALRRKLEGVL